MLLKFRKFLDQAVYWVNNFLIAATSVYVGFLRASGEKGEAYQAEAHIWIGFLLRSCFYSSEKRRPWYILLTVGLIVTEIVCFGLTPTGHQLTIGVEQWIYNLFKKVSDI